MDGPHTSRGTQLLRASERSQSWLAKRYRTTVRQAGRWLAGAATPDGSSQALMARDKVLGCIPADAWTTAPVPAPPDATPPAPLPPSPPAAPVVPSPAPAPTPTPPKKATPRKAAKSPAPPGTNNVPVTPAPGDLRTQAQAEIARLDRILADPDLARGAQLQASKAKLSAIAAIAKLEGQNLTEAMIVGHPAHRRIMHTVRQALESHPEALRAVAEALRALFDREGG